MKGLVNHILANIEEVENEIREGLESRENSLALPDKKIDPRNKSLEEILRDL